jgi:aspartate aminotransferase
MARGLVGSEILRIAADIRALRREGRAICDLTVGDFDPRQFPIPDRLRSGIVSALERGETNYPPSNGVLELRESVRGFYARELGLDYPRECVLIAGGARPLLYGTFRALVDPGERVVYPVPSWNNNHYAHLVGAEGMALPCDAASGFLPRTEDIARALEGARLVCLNSPLNPSGTSFEPAVLRGICEALVAENRARERRGERPAYLLYDQVYWMLQASGHLHVTPPGLVPETARWTILVDGISKAFAATGVRVGWALGPADLIERMSAVLGHVGAWAPRAEQVATAELYDDAEAVREHLASFQEAILARLRRLHRGFTDLRAEGQAVDALEPAGTIYLAARIHPFGRRTARGSVLTNSEDVRRWLLEEAALAIVPFQAFGVTQDEGWFRLSVGAVGEREIEEALPRLGSALHSLRA